MQCKLKDLRPMGEKQAEAHSHDMLVKPLPAGCRLTAIFDSCHSGTVMDLPYVVSLLLDAPCTGGR